MSDPATSPPAKDPLAVLEELLTKRKQNGTSGDASAGPDPEIQAAQELAQKQAEIERLQAESAVRDAALLAEQRQKMQEIGSLPQYQARVKQNEAEQQKKQLHSEQRGFKIHQLSTTRVPAIKDPQE